MELNALSDTSHDAFEYPPHVHKRPPPPTELLDSFEEARTKAGLGTVCMGARPTRSQMRTLVGALQEKYPRFTAAGTPPLRDIYSHLLRSCSSPVSASSL